MKLAAALLSCLALTGCGVLRPGAVPISVPIPVECHEAVPPRPAMPTEGLAPGVALDLFVKASQAEIEVREGYEGQLLAALVACTEPIEKGPVGP